jgi:hypothetical protein
MHHMYVPFLVVNARLSRDHAFEGGAQASLHDDPTSHAQTADHA